MLKKLKIPTKNYPMEKETLSNTEELVIPAFFRHLDPEHEFGISRCIADPVYYLPQLLRNFVIELAVKNTYVIKSEVKNSQGVSIKLEKRFHASCLEEAQKLTKILIQNLTGRQSKVWLACWKMANDMRRQTFKCSLTKLMNLAYPKRTAYFSTKEKLLFYEDLLELQATQFTISKDIQLPHKKKPSVKSYCMPFVQIHTKIEESKKTRYPSMLTLSVLDHPALHKERLYRVPASIKNKTLELHADDLQLAKIVQIRSSQQQNSEYLVFDRDYLIYLAQLEGTEIANKPQANQALMDKLKRLCDADIIKSYPEKIADTVYLKVR